MASALAAAAVANGTHLVAGRQVESSESPARKEDYVIIDGVRLVRPYHFDFVCGMKQRWVGQSIVDIFAREFPARNRDYYRQAVADGRLRVEGREVGPDTPLADGARMRHFIHRHEPPVPAAPIEIVGESDGVVAVCKPHGTPVHVAGQYRKNTVQSILQAERPDLGPLLPVHRLDKPVSGLLLFARTKEAANEVRRQIEGRDVQKVYVARVMGVFPSTPQTLVVDVPLSWDPRANQASAVPEAAAALSAAAEGSRPASAAGAEAAGQAAGGAAVAAVGEEGEEGDDAATAASEGASEGGGSVKAGSCKRSWREARKEKYARKLARKAADAAARAAAAEAGTLGAKPSLTEFRLLAVAPDRRTSLVECRPRTGRTHQIRVHLQYTGHPIANDNQYGGQYPGPMSCRAMAQQMGVAWEQDAPPSLAAALAAAEAAKARRQQQQAEEEASQQQQEPSCDDGQRKAGEQQQAAQQADQRQEQEQGQQLSAAGGEMWEANAAFRSEARFEAPAGLRDPLCLHCPYYAAKDYPADLRPLWLHAASYSCAAWSYKTKLPDWAAEGYVPAAPPGVEAQRGEAGAAVAAALEVAQQQQQQQQQQAATAGGW